MYAGLYIVGGRQKDKEVCIMKLLDKALKSHVCSLKGLMLRIRMDFCDP